MSKSSEFYEIHNQEPRQADGSNHLNELHQTAVRGLSCFTDPEQYKCYVRYIHGVLRSQGCSNVFGKDMIEEFLQTALLRSWSNAINQKIPIETIGVGYIFTSIRWIILSYLRSNYFRKTSSGDAIIKYAYKAPNHGLVPLANVSIRQIEFFLDGHIANNQELSDADLDQLSKMIDSTT